MYEYIPYGLPVRRNVLTNEIARFKSWRRPPHELACVSRYTFSLAWYFYSVALLEREREREREREIY
jgi:hypothetical protein